MCTTDRLIAAAYAIGLITGKEVTAIQFEDGSGCKFNFQTGGTSTWTFIDLANYDMRAHYFQVSVLQDLLKKPARIF